MAGDDKKELSGLARIKKLGFRGWNDYYEYLKRIKKDIDKYCQEWGLEATYKRYCVTRKTLERLGILAPLRNEKTKEQREKEALGKMGTAGITSLVGTFPISFDALITRMLELLAEKDAVIERQAQGSGEKDATIAELKAQLEMADLAHLREELAARDGVIAALKGDNAKLRDTLNRFIAEGKGVKKLSINLYALRELLRGNDKT